MTLMNLDRQLQLAQLASETPTLSDQAWRRLATTVHDEIARLDECTLNQLRLSVLVPPERYVEELAIFEDWMEIAHANGHNPTVARAQVITELYMAFVRLPQSIMKQTAAAMSEESAVARIERFLSTGRRGKLRDAVAHGRWSCLPDLGGIEYWSEPALGYERVEVGQLDLDAWQLLSRGAAVAAVLALT
jgi:hypothetical protein